MQRISLLLLFLTSLLFSNDDFTPWNYSLNAGGSLYGFSYSEKFTDELYNQLYPNGIPPMLGEPKSDEYGVTPNIHIAIETNKKIYFAIAGNLGVTSKHTYDGSTQGVNATQDTAVYEPLKITNKQNMFTSLELKSGYKIPIQENSSVTPYVGLRINRWKRALGFYTDYNTLLQLDTFSTYEMREIYHWSQCMIGAKLESKRSEEVTLFLESSFDIMMSGSMEYIDEITESFDSATEVTLGNKAGTTIALGLTKRYSKKFAASIVPFYQYYHFGLSNEGTQKYGNEKLTFYEPESKSHLFGLKLTAYILFKGNDE